MATLISYQDGNWTGSTTWKAIATGTNASMTTTTSSTNTTTSYVDSSAFTVTTSQVLEGILLSCRRLTTTGTVSVALSDDNGTTATREVTVNAADLPAYKSWVFFKFGSTLTADGGSDYKVKVKASSADNAAFYRNSTAGNWARIIRKSTTASLAAGDVSYICNELTGAGTKNDITVTMNETATTAYGEVNIVHGGVLSFGTSASTNYVLRLSADMYVWGGGTLNIGTSGTPVPSTSTAYLQLNSDDMNQGVYGLYALDGSTVNIYGPSKTTDWTLLTGDAASGQASLTVAATSGWLAGDAVAVASTTRTLTQGEQATILTVDSGTGVTLTANLTNTHHGTSPYQGEVINLTRAVGINQFNMPYYMSIAAAASFTASNAMFRYTGSNIIGFSVATTSAGSFSAKGCAFSLTSSQSNAPMSFTGTSGSPVLENCVLMMANGSNPITFAGTSGTPSIKGNVFISNVTGLGVTFSDVGGTIQDNRFGGCAVTLSEAGGTLGTIKDNIQHSASTGFTLGGTGVIMSGTFDGLTAWRNSANGIVASGGGYSIANASVYHNATANFDSSSTGAIGVTVGSSTFNGGTGASLAATGYHIRSANTPRQMVFDSCSFSATNATQSGLFLGSSGLGMQDVVFRKCTIADSTIVDSQSNLLATQEFTSAVKFDKYNNTAGSHRAYKRYGYTASDQSTYKTAAPSEALLPNGGSGNKLPSGSKKFAVASGTTATVTVYVNKSGTYNGNQPRLIVKANSIAGIASDTVLATASGGTGSWLSLSGTTATVSDDCVLEVYVDCDGTAGTVYVDDWSIT